VTVHVPVRIGPAEQKLIDQLRTSGADAAAERLAASGLPTRKVESYHYTDLKMLLRAVPELAIAAKALSEPALRIPGAHRIPVTNGVADISGAMPPGMHATISHGPALSERDDVLVRLNTALAQQTLKLEIRSRATQVVHIDRRTESADPAHMNDSVHLFVADDSKATVIETFSGTDEAHLSNHANFVAIGRNAEFTHILLDLSSGKATNFAVAEYQIGAGAKVRTLTIHVGSALSRMNLFATFAGEGATADFTGLNLVTEGQHSDITLEATHAMGHCGCKPLYKQVARGRSTAAFQGKIIVARDAQKTDAKLMMQGLMLSDQAQILSKPELEIFADDVVCGHGSTVGALDEDWMFYLKSRGIPTEVAESMLVRGFIEELLDPIEDEELHLALEGSVENWLAEK
jgi:Fe-S cluster assembly protein SufD